MDHAAPRCWLDVIVNSVLLPALIAIFNRVDRSRN
jgi:hypothetical protein